MCRMLFFLSVFPWQKTRADVFMAFMKKTVANWKKLFIIEHKFETSKGRRTMGVVMKEQDKRAIESMCRCGLDLEGVISVFPTFPKEDVMAIYNAVKGLDAGNDGELNISMNCS